MEASYNMNVNGGNLNHEDNFFIERSDSNTSVVDSMVDATKKSTSWVVDTCSMCTEYMDKQVQYEIMSQRFQGAAEAASASLRPSGTFDLQSAVGACHQNFDDIKATAAMMFDEESVVESVDHR